MPLAQDGGYADHAGGHHDGKHGVEEKRPATPLMASTTLDPTLDPLCARHGSGYPIRACGHLLADTVTRWWLDDIRLGTPSSSVAARRRVVRPGDV